MAVVAAPALSPWPHVGGSENRLLTPGAYAVVFSPSCSFPAVSLLSVSLIHRLFAGQARASSPPQLQKQQQQQQLLPVVTLRREASRGRRRHWLAYPPAYRGGLRFYVLSTGSGSKAWTAGP